MTMQPILSVKDLVVAYGESVILDGVSLEVKPSEVFVILGGSGCGKTTLMRAMVGLVPPRAGTVEIDGDEISAEAGVPFGQLSRKIGVMFQSGALFGSMSLLENVRLPLEEFTNLPPDAMDWIARLKLRLVGLDAFVSHLPSEISGGMRKRAAIARAMALDPKILFLDEPSAGLDPITSAELDALIRELAESLSITFLVVSHELASIEAIADRAILLDREVKGVVAEGTPAELRDHPTCDLARRFFRREVAPAAARDQSQGRNKR